MIQPPIHGRKSRTSRAIHDMNVLAFLYQVSDISALELLPEHCTPIFMNTTLRTIRGHRRQIILVQGRMQQRALALKIKAMLAAEATSRTGSAISGSGISS